MAPRRAVVYVRISVDRDEQTSTDSQERTARAYAESKGWSVVQVEVDKGRSAFKDNARRPGLERALKMVENGAADTIIVWKLDRFVRSVSGFGKLWTRLESAGASFVSVTDAFDTTTAMGRAMLQIAVVFAELESGIKSERIGAWHEERTLAGASPTGPRPYGYHRDNGSLTVDQDEADVIRSAADQLLSGESLSAVRRSINECGHRTARGGEWNNNTVSRVLTNTTTAALREVDGVLLEGSWEPILDRDTWDRVRTILHDPKRRHSPGPERRWLLSGRLTCEKCGSVMRPRKHKNGPRYGCTGDHCAISVPIDRTDELVVGALLELIDRDAWQRLRNAQTAPGVDVASLEAELASLADLYGRGEISFDEWQIARKGITERTARADVAPAELPEVDDLGSSWEGLTIEARQMVVDAIANKIKVKPGVQGARKFDADRLSIEWAV